MLVCVKDRVAFRLHQTGLRLFSEKERLQKIQSMLRKQGTERPMGIQASAGAADSSPGGCFDTVPMWSPNIKEPICN